MTEYKVENHISSFLPDGKWKMVFNDEFDGPELDTSKWYFRLHMAGKRHDAWIEDAISFDGDSNIIFHLVEKDSKYYSSALQTGENYTDRPDGESKNIKPKFMHKYGYYEVRCKLQRETPWWSAFWLQAQNVAILENPEEAGVEVDILEGFIPGSYIPHFNHWGGYGEGHKFANSAGFDRDATADDAIAINPDEFHTFGVHWSEDGYTFYVDGKQSGRRITEPVSRVEQFVLLTTECKGYRPGKVPGYDGKETFGSGIKDFFTVDYVRVFEEE